MNLKEILTKDDSIINVKGAVFAVDPPETLFGATYFSHMIPCFKPETMLILGYGHGVVAKLTRKIWGEKIKITGVDTNPGTYKHIEHRIVVGDAYDYVKHCTDSMFKTRYDYICIDLYDENVQIPDYVFQTEFVVRLREMCKKMLCTNFTQDDLDSKRMKCYSEYGFNWERVVPIEAQRIIHWSVIHGK